MKSDQPEAGDALVTFAIYDEVPIACQGDDDQSRIQVIRSSVSAGSDIHRAAQQMAMNLGKEHDVHVQVWDVEAPDASDDSPR